MFKRFIKVEWMLGFDNLDKRQFFKMQRLIESNCTVIRVLTRNAKPDDEYWSDVFIVKGTEEEMIRLISKIEKVQFVEDWGLERF